MIWKSEAKMHFFNGKEYLMKDFAEIKFYPRRPLLIEPTMKYKNLKLKITWISVIMLGTTC